MSQPDHAAPAVTLSIVIPAYNEAQRLPANLVALRDFLRDQGWDATTEVIVVDDGSRDDTVIAVARLVRGWPGLSIITLPHAGKGAAIRQGVFAARGEYIFFCDADLAMSLDQLPRFLPPASPFCDIVIASREAPGAQRIGEKPYRHVMGRVFNRLVGALTMPGIADTQCGFKRFTRAAARDLCGLQRMNGFSFDVELLALARLRGYTIAELPIIWRNDPNSRVRPVRDALRMARDVWRIRQRVKDDRLHRDPHLDRTIEATAIPSAQKTIAALLARRRAAQSNPPPP